MCVTYRTTPEDVLAGSPIDIFDRTWTLVVHVLPFNCLKAYDQDMCIYICRTARECSETITVNGFTFPKGLVVQVPIYCLHNNPEYWPEPDKFDPNR